MSEADQRDKLIVEHDKWLAKTHGDAERRKSDWARYTIGEVGRPKTDRPKTILHEVDKSKTNKSDCNAYNAWIASPDCTVSPDWIGEPWPIKK